MSEFHMPPHQVDALRALLQAMPYGGKSVPMDTMDIVGTESLLAYLGLLKNALLTVVEDVEKDRFELNQYRRLVDGLRWSQRVINQKPGERLAAP
jgi:hypothetical protein